VRAVSPRGSRVADDLGTKPDAALAGAHGDGTLRAFAARQILDFARRDKRLLARFVATAIGRAATSMAVILLIRDFLAGVLGGPTALPGFMVRVVGPEPALWAAAGLLMLAYVGSSLLSYDNQVAEQRIVKSLELGTMERLIRHLLTLSVPFFDRQSHGDIVQAIRQDVTNLRVVVISVCRIFLEGTLAVALLAAALWLSVSLTLSALIAVPAALLPMLLIARHTLARSYRVRRSGYVLFDMILQILRGIRTIKAYQGETREVHDAVRKGRIYFDDLISMVRTRSLSQVVLESMGGAGIVVVIVLGGLHVMRGSLPWPDLLAFLMAARALHGPLYNINSNYIQIQQFGASLQRIDELLKASPEVADGPDPRPMPSGPDRIAFDNVGFAYDGTVVLEELSFGVRAGETLGIVGPSGSGKTTLLNLIVRFYDPTTGRISFDGVDLREYRLADVYAKVAIVTQTPFLFATTVRDNIRLGRPEASETDVEAAAQAADVHEEILALPEGYDTLIGAGGRQLSGGQAQRISVARAILKNAPFLLLDEATSSLDSLAETRVQRAIDRLMAGRTTFIVAHRLSTLRRAGRILVLDRGRCVGLGAHDELLRDCPLYRSLWEMQLMSEPAAKRATNGAAAEREDGALDSMPSLHDHHLS
jgi:ABC-type multidrug transport system fused ATPase/permease subunit